tara:strand:- start:5192 stop:5596 length:405 start_codon:yes stop_codon:yes gene_type:complete
MAPKKIPMAVQTFELPWGFPTLNDLLQMTSQHWRRRSKSKKDWAVVIAARIKAAKIKPTIGAVHVTFRLVPPNARRDPDNASAVIRKYVLDVLQDVGVIEQDNWGGIIGLDDDYAKPDKNNPHIVITLRGHLKK